jgi:hypothetical protein
VEELEHHYLQLSGNMDTISDSIAHDENQRAVLKVQHSDFQEVRLTDIVEPAQREVGVHEIQNPQENTNLGNLQVPFFYLTPEKRGEVHVSLKHRQDYPGEMGMGLCSTPVPETATLSLLVLPSNPFILRAAISNSCFNKAHKQIQLLCHFSKG